MEIFEMERELIAYLRACGNTRELELFKYGKKVLGQPKENMQKILNKMQLEGYMQRVGNDKLGFEVVYVGKGNLPLDLALDIEADAVELKDKNRLQQEAKKILKQARIAAEKKHRTA